MMHVKEPCGRMNVQVIYEGPVLLLLLYAHFDHVDGTERKRLVVTKVYLF